MGHFDADAALAARTPWSITLRGRRYVARLVSWPAFVAFQEAMKLANGEPLATGRAIRGLWCAAFPWKLRYLWQGDPVRRLMALDEDLHYGALADFLAHRGRIGKNPGRPLTTTGSGDSSAATPPSPSGSA